jgi:hypothetical protein
VKQSNWFVKGEKKLKSAKSPKFQKRRAKALKQMMQKLKTREDSEMFSPLIFVLN